MHVKLANDPLWSSMAGGGIGGTLFFKWMKENKVGYRSSFPPVWYHFLREYPWYDHELYEEAAREIHTHYYECGQCGDFDESYANPGLGLLIKTGK